jgi:small conductance mechanosensitive channel
MFGVNTTALLASAGVVSIAVGMGAQSMAADLLAGFFMMLEGSIHVGDHVNVSGITGYVTDMGIRTTEITDEDGNVVILNNSKVSPVCNMSRNHEQQEESENAPEDNPEDNPEDVPEEKS